MTKRHATRAVPVAETPDLPALRDFARGYLHEDVLAEHGGAIGAAGGFVRDATAAEIRALSGDLTRLVSTAAHWPDDTLATYFRKTLKSAWLPRSFADLRALEAEVRRYRT